MDAVMNRSTYPRIIETIKGKIYKMARPALKHIEAGGNLNWFFRNYFRGRDCKYFSEPTVQLGESEVVPDICVVCDKSKLTETRIIGTPDLVVEILSPSTRKKDIEEKHPLYEEHGVKEYWMVDPVAGFVEIYTLLDSGKYTNLPRSYSLLSDEDKVNLTSDGMHHLIVEEVTSTLFPNLTIQLSELFDYL